MAFIAAVLSNENSSEIKVAISSLANAGEGKRKPKNLTDRAIAARLEFLWERYNKLLVALAEESVLEYSGGATKAWLTERDIVTIITLVKAKKDCFCFVFKRAFMTLAAIR